MNSSVTYGRRLTLESVWGWSDYRNGFGYRAGYDSWPESAQRNYENGRLRAANTGAAFGKVPAHQSRRAFYDAAYKVGKASPDPRQLW